MVVQQHHHRPVAAGVGIHETGRRRPLQPHPLAPLLLGVEPAQLRRRVVGHGPIFVSVRRGCPRPRRRAGIPRIGGQ